VLGCGRTDQGLGLGWVVRAPSRVGGWVARALGWVMVGFLYGLLRIINIIHKSKLTRPV
jgi:hypothetical protein